MENKGKAFVEDFLKHGEWEKHKYTSKKINDAGDIRYIYGEIKQKTKTPKAPIYSASRLDGDVKEGMLIEMGDPKTGKTKIYTVTSKKHSDGRIMLKTEVTGRSGSWDEHYIYNQRSKKLIKIR